MAEDDPKPDDKPKDDPKPDDKPKDDGSDTAEEAKKWKALARKHEAQAKANADAAKKLKDLEDADKSELEKLTTKASEAETRAAQAELRALRYEVAAEKGLTGSMAKRLVGTTREELEADADEILETFGGPDKGEGGDKKPPARKPNEKLKGGNEPDADTEPNIAEIVKSIPRL